MAVTLSYAILLLISAAYVADVTSDSVSLYQSSPIKVILEFEEGDDEYANQLPEFQQQLRHIFDNIPDLSEHLNTLQYWVKMAGFSAAKAKIRELQIVSKYANALKTVITQKPKSLGARYFNGLSFCGDPWCFIQGSIIFNFQKETPDITLEIGSVSFVYYIPVTIEGHLQISSDPSVGVSVGLLRGSVQARIKAGYHSEERLFAVKARAQLSKKTGVSAYLRVSKKEITGGFTLSAGSLFFYNFE